MLRDLNIPLPNLDITPSEPLRTDLTAENGDIFDDDRTQLIYVEKGLLFAIIDGKHYVTLAGQMLLLPADIPHTVWYPTGAITKVIRFAFRAYESGEDIFLRHGLYENDLVIFVSDEDITAIYNRARTTPKATDPVAFSYNQAAQMGMLTALYFEARIRMETSLPEFSDVIAYMENNLSEDISVDRLSAIMYMNPTYFCTRFRQHTGFTPMKYLTHLRIREATRLMRETDLDMKEIAHRIGIENVYYLKTFFKKNVFMTPEDYRQLLLGKDLPGSAPEDRLGSSQKAL